ncbi:hypothetical protein Hanom_Chr12g01146561 [Helianthus anomalus]
MHQYRLRVGLGQNGLFYPLTVYCHLNCSKLINALILITKSILLQSIWLLIKGFSIWLLTSTKYITRVRYLMTNVFGDPKRAPPLLERLSPKDKGFNLECFYTIRKASQ